VKPRVAAALGVAVVLAMLGFSAWAWLQLPASTPLPIHWDASGNANGYASKPVALLIAPAITASVILVMLALPRIEPRRANLLQSVKAYSSIFLALVLFLASVHVATVSAALSDRRLHANLVTVGLGLLVAVLGNYLGKLRSNFLVGIRTPWTLSSDLSWNRTHRLAGRLLVTCGLAITALALVGYRSAITVAVAMLLAVALISAAYSYLVWRDERARSVIDT